MKYSILGISLGILAVSIMVLGSLFIGFAPNATAVNVTDNATIDITVATETMIDMNPAEFVWTAVDPGTDAGEAVGNQSSAQIENIGSTNITALWFNVTQPAVRPFATGTNASYNSANFVWISKENADEYYAVDRREYNETRSLIYLTDPAGNIPPDGSTYSYGRFRNTSMEYFWYYAKSGDASCGNLYVGDDFHSQGVTGTIDFSSGCGGAGNALTDAPNGDCRSGATASGVGDFCYADVNIGGELYVVAVHDDGTDEGDYLRWTHWNADAPGGRSWRASGNYNDYFSTLTIYPGNSTVADLKIYLPYGVAQGKLSQGVLTVIASNAEVD